MNHIHKVIFNTKTQQFVVVSELAKSTGKPKSISADTVDIVSLLRNFSEKQSDIETPFDMPVFRLEENAEPNQVQKRLGDGFYEQRVIREQINRLTGRQFLGNDTDFDTQYRSLMEAGVTFAQQFNLRPGIALTPSQVAQLTTDIVWFETQSVRLPNGKVETVLAPKVYAMVQKGDMTGNGTLLSGNRVSHQGGEFINSGTVAGRELVRFDSDSIRNSGKVSGGAIVGNISGDVENIGGTIEADRAILLNVAGNFTHRSTTQTTEVNEQGYQRMICPPKVGLTHQLIKVQIFYD